MQSAQLRLKIIFMAIICSFVFASTVLPLAWLEMHSDSIAANKSEWIITAFGPNNR